MNDSDMNNTDYLIDENYRLSISCSVRAGAYESGDGASVNMAEFKDVARIDLAALLSRIYYEYIGPIFATVDPEGRTVTIESKRGTAAMTYPGKTKLDLGTFGLSYATCDITVYLSRQNHAV